MELFEEQERTPQLLSGLLEVWEASVRTSHRFLTEPEIQRIRGYVPQALAEVPCLITAGEGPERPGGSRAGGWKCFSSLRRSGGRAWEGGFWRMGSGGTASGGLRSTSRTPGHAHMGFETYRRTDWDEEGGPYPLLYMRLREQG